jgi:putative oxidoreductase
MKIAATISRYLLGLVFTVFGLNGFLNFIPPQPMPPLAMQFIGPLMQSHYMAFVFAVQVAGGLLLLANQYVPLALTLLGPVLVNIVLFHLLIAPAGLPLALVVVLLWSVLFYRYRGAFSGLFVRQTT